MPRYENAANLIRRAGVTITSGPELSCRSCGSRLAAAAKFCSECGQPLIQIAQGAEYKQVTVLFADVVHSMALP
jgi:hypothetical protein